MHNVRQYKLLNELRSRKQITIKDLAILLNASYRTIQNDLNELKRVLEDNGAQIISRTGKGISLDIQDKQKFSKFLDVEEKNFSKSEDDTVSLTNEVIYELVSVMDYVKVDDLADKFYVSRSKISIVLKELKIELENYKLQIVSKPSYGIMINGDEINIRKLLFDLYSYFYNYLVFKDNDFQKDELKAFVLNNLKEHKYMIASNTFEALYQTLVIMINRVETNHISQISDRELSYLYELEEFEISKNLLQKVGVLLKLEFPLSEIAYISKFLSGNRKYDVDSLQRFEDSVQYDLDRLIQSILKSIKQKYHEDFRQDFELYMSLGLHMIPLISRIRFEFSINNPLLEEIKRNYPLPYDMAIESALVLRKEFDIVLDENEISYFALHFNLALERKKQVIELKKVLIVCSSGGGLAKLLAFKVKNSFSKYISSIDTTDIHELNDLEMEKYDYILTTIPLPYTLNKPTLHISHMLDAQDIHELSTILSNDEFELGLLDIVAQDIFYTDIIGETKEEIIKNICNHIKDTRNIQDDFYEQVLERESLFTTEIGNYLAFPHPLVQKTDDTFISVSILSKPVKWDKNLVQVILLGTTRKGDSSRLQKMYEEFAIFVSNKKNMIELIKNPTFEMLEQVIKKLN